MRRLLILMIMAWVPVVHAEDPDVRYEKNVQNRLMDNFDWQMGPRKKLVPVLNNIFQFGKDFRIKPQFEKGSGCFNGDPWNSESFRFVRGTQPSWVAYSHVRQALRMLRTWVRNPLFVSWYVYHQPDRVKNLEHDLSQMGKDAFRGTVFDRIMGDAKTSLWAKIFRMISWLQQTPWIFESWIDISEEDFNAKTQEERKQIRDGLKRDFGPEGVISKVRQSLVDDQHALQEGKDLAMWKMLRGDQHPEGLDKSEFYADMGSSLKVFLRQPVTDVSFNDVDDPVLSVSQTQDSITLDFQQECRFVAGGISQIYSHKGCVCRVEIPTAIDVRTPIKFTLYKWGYAHYTDLRVIPADKFTDVLAEFKLLRQIVDQKLSQAVQKVPAVEVTHPEPTAFDLDHVMFGDHKPEVLGSIDAIRTESE